MLTLNYNIDSLLVRNPLLMASFPKRSTLTTAYGIIEDGKLDGKERCYICLTLTILTQTIGKCKSQNNWWSTPIKEDSSINSKKLIHNHPG
jgi:hypothetical protein